MAEPVDLKRRVVWAAKNPRNLRILETCRFPTTTLVIAFDFPGRRISRTGLAKILDRLVRARLLDVVPGRPKKFLTTAMGRRLLEVMPCKSRPGIQYVVGVGI